MSFLLNSVFSFEPWMSFFLNLPGIRGLFFEPALLAGSKKDQGSKKDTVQKKTHMFKKKDIPPTALGQRVLRACGAWSTCAACLRRLVSVWSVPTVLGERVLHADGAWSTCVACLRRLVNACYMPTALGQRVSHAYATWSTRGTCPRRGISFFWNPVIFFLN